MKNEKRLIDVNALIKETESIINFRKKHYMPTIEYEALLDYVNKLPTVDAVLEVYGRWYKAPYHPYRCSCCDEMALLDMYGESQVRSNYCPNCGAKMDGGGND